VKDNDAVFARVRKPAAIVLVVLYVLGLVAMFLGNVQLGAALWVASTLGGIGLLYWKRTIDRRSAKEEAPRADEPPKGET